MPSDCRDLFHSRFCHAGQALLLSAQLLAAQPGVELRGIVADRTGGTSEGAEARVLDAGSRELCRAVTGPDGGFRCASLPAGVWRVVAAKPGWQRREMRLEADAGESAAVEIRLEPESPRFAVSVVEEASVAVRVSAVATRTQKGLLDGAAYYRDLSNVEQVEVLRGPGSVLFGSGSAGGSSTVDEAAQQRAADRRIQPNGGQLRGEAGDGRPARPLRATPHRLSAGQAQPEPGGPRCE